MREPVFAYAKTKAQLRCAFVFATLYFLNPKIFKPLAIFFGCTARFVSDLVRSHEDRFADNAADS